MNKSKTTCPRCYGPAEMISKMPRGGRGDVVRCAREERCAQEHEAAKDLEQAHAAVADAALEFERLVGKLGTPLPAEVKIPGHVVADLLDAVREWKEAGRKMVETQRAA